MDTRPYVLIDGMNLYMRFLMVSQQTSTVGEPCGGVLGFLKAVKWINRRLSPARLYVIWESGGGSARRKSLFSEYKANRTKTKFNTEVVPNLETKAKQLQVLTSALGHLPICQVYVEGAEADDVIGYLVKHKFADNHIQKIVVSNDKDFYQLVGPSVSIYDPARRILVDTDHVKAIYEIAPENFVLARAVVGDDSDNIPGIAGIGLKTIAKRFKELLEPNDKYDIDWIVQTAKTFAEKPGKVLKCYSAIAEGKDVILRNWHLMYLDTNNLAANQISKINYRIDSHIPTINKLEYLKTFMSEDIPVSQDLEQLVQELRQLTISS